MTPYAEWTDRRWAAPLASAEYRTEVWRRLIAAIRIDPDSGCWVWQRHIDCNGYGKISVKARMVRAHCVALMIERAANWPAELQVDHLCRNRACCNPAHLELVTPAENVRRGLAPTVSGEWQRAKTHCAQGHPYDEFNTTIKRDGSRRCIECHRADARRRWAVRRDA